MRLMRRLRPIMLAWLVVCGLALAADPALAASPVISDCAHHNRLTHRYSISELQAALAQIPPDIKEYTDCYAVIDNQLYQQLRGKVRVHGGGTASGGSSFPTALVVALVVIVLAGGGAAYAAFRRSRGGGGPPEPPAATRSRPT